MQAGASGAGSVGREGGLVLQHFLAGRAFCSEQSPCGHFEENHVLTHVSLVGCRASGCEGLRLRCCDAECPSRESGSENKPDIMVEDEEEPDFENAFEQGEDDIGDAEGLLGNPAASQGSAESSVNLFPYAAPLAAHKKVLMEILRASEPLGISRGCIICLLVSVV